MRVVYAAMLVLFAVAPALAQGQPQDPTAKCRAVENNCQACKRNPDGRLVCSNIGIACQPVLQPCRAEGGSPQPQAPDKRKEQ